MCSCDVQVHPPFYEDDNNQGLRSKGFIPKQHASVVRDKDDDTPVMVGVDCVMKEWRTMHECPDCWGGDTNLIRSLAATSNIKNRI